VSDWNSKALRKRFRDGIADGLGDGITSMDVNITGVEAASVIVSFDVKQAASYTGTPVSDKMTTAASRDALISSVEESTGHTVEQSPTVTARTRLGEDGEVEALGVLSPSAVNGAIAGGVLGGLALCACCVAGFYYWRKAKGAQKQVVQIEPAPDGD